MKTLQEMMTESKMLPAMVSEASGDTTSREGIACAVAAGKDIEGNGFAAATYSRLCMAWMMANEDKANAIMVERIEARKAQEQKLSAMEPQWV